MPGPGDDHGGKYATTRYALTVPVVIDTNVFIGACLGGGPSSSVVGACLRGEQVPLMGAALLAEYEEVLGRSILFKKCRLSEVERYELLDIFLGTCRWTRIYFGWRPNLPDEDDNHLVELAVAGGATHIITHNVRDLVSRDLKFPDLAVVTPSQFLKKKVKT